MSRKIDALVAEHVMGLEVKSVIKEFITEGGFSDEPKKELFREKVEDFIVSDGPIYVDCPHYSTDISAAWLVVEKLNNEGYRIFIDNGNKWMCQFIVPDKWSTQHPEDTAPMAICLAALKAKGVDYDNDIYGEDNA